MSRLENLPLPPKDHSGGLTKITAGIGDGRGHQGVDWGTSDGIEVGTLEYPVVAGTVVRIANDGPFRPPNGHIAGLNLWLLGDNGTRWKYFHTNRVLVAEGTHVELGTPIAEVGNSGTQAAHLHLEEHAGSWSNFVNFEADARAALGAGRWPDSTASMAAPIVVPQTNTMKEKQAVARGDQFRFPDGTSYLLAVHPTDTGFGWIHIGGPKYLDQGRAEGLIGELVRPLGSGTDSNDALFESHPVLTGPHKRSTHT